MFVRVFCSLGVGMATGVATLVGAMCIDGWVRPHPAPGSYGMYGFLYGLILAPLMGLAAAAWMYMGLRRRARQAEAAAAPMLREQ